MLEHEQIVCISSVDWEPLWTRKQQVMSRLPKSNQILYVEPPISLLSPFKDPQCWGKWRLWLNGVRRLNENIYLYSPPVVLPFGNICPGINRLNQWWIGLFLKKVMKKLHFTRPILWTYLPNTVHLLGRLREKFRVYDCVDEHSAYTGFNKDAVQAMEHELLAQCDIVFTTAQGLYEEKKKYNPNTHLVPNAANVEHFSLAQHPATPVPADIAQLPHPIIGFIGAIRDWIDLDLIEEIARRHPEWSVVMVGPVGVDINIEPLTRYPNLYFFGHRERGDLPGYLKAFDVCINPFRLNELTMTVSPLKFYEYLASGKPIVSVAMPEVEPFADVVEIGRNVDEFIQGIERALTEDTEEKKNQRLAIARENTWESRVQTMMEKIVATMLGQAARGSEK